MQFLYSLFNVFTFIRDLNVSQFVITLNINKHDKQLCSIYSVGSSLLLFLLCIDLLPIFWLRPVTRFSRCHKTVQNVHRNHDCCDGVEGQGPLPLSIIWSQRIHDQRNDEHRQSHSCRDLSHNQRSVWPGDQTSRFVEPTGVESKESSSDSHNDQSYASTVCGDKREDNQEDSHGAEGNGVVDLCFECFTNKTNSVITDSGDFFHDCLTKRR